MKYTREVLEPIVAESRSVADVLRKLGIRIAGGSHTNVKQRIKLYGLDTSHFLGHRANSGTCHRGGAKRKKPSEILILKPEDSAHTGSQILKRALLEIGRPHECELCGLNPVWRDKPLQLQIDHKNGKRWDNRRGNVRILCPNCHSQTSTFGSKNNHVPKVEYKCKLCKKVLWKKAKTGMCLLCERRTRKSRLKNHAPVV